jgi:hypothetical protein
MLDDVSGEISVSSRMRGSLKVILGFSMLGVAAELALLGHTEEVAQRVPLVLLGLGFLTLLAMRRPSVWALRAFLLTMALFVFGGVLGVWLHYRGNVEFELEMSPASAGWELFREAMTGATPALAPGTMVLLGLVGLVVGYRHPRLRGEAPETGELG